ncbi:transmembrane secretion effector [Caldicellulosiruptor bescii]|uniref:Major facilitator superfamily MFS_1 n=2 Tax=Caldicellulosiruptor bescii TaxID=31899 RepID=B9MMU7_CALBD|nr:MFS transporter [Caldicellulosiruptor bescii]ACM61396.1 major facilitator superfamily MFS_1 [Caldicellulosiruptor bescii DSM 6725]PBC88792.1 transmembrane secretion effector [Caldicellulosiruptor bescii]PBC91726.1 transmembrane secretion effector [Caldicellulosiruptor bescii]PBD02862.1 transmembrane secretion effector [Caldicellulosiruptor bescii]PBD07522.1 transmembrane secretion effector [Caldicellulosiruptor bescii]
MQYVLFSGPFRALRHKNYRYYWFGQAISVIGSWMQNMAMQWLALSITNSALLLSIVTACEQVPVMFISLFAGAILDKRQKRRIILLTQSLLLFFAFILFLITYTHTVRYWHLVVLAILRGLVTTFDNPARQSYMITLVGKEDLPNAVGLNSMIFNLARIIGPAVASLVISTAGIEMCFLANAISFVPVIIGVFLIDAKEPQKEENGKSVFSEVVEGLKYVYMNKVLLRAISLVLIMGIFILNFNVLIPVYAKLALGRNETGFGFLMSSMGIGSLMGAFLTATRRKEKINLNLLFKFILSVSIVYIFLGLNKSYAVACVLFVFVGLLAISFNTSANALLQLSSSDDFRARVLSIYFLCNAGTTPIGNLFTGTISQKISPWAGFYIPGLATIALTTMVLITTFKKKNLEKTK